MDWLAERRAALAGGWRVAVVAFLLLGGALRWTGLDRDVVDFVLPQAGSEGRAETFYSFHPDERSVVDGALAFDDPLHPPYTMYGALPFYLLRGALTGLSWFGEITPGSDDVYRVGKILSAALSVACLAAAWGVARQVFSPATAALSVLLLAVAPTAVQQAHYYTVDSLFCLLTTASLAAILYSVPRRSWLASIVAGVCLGLSASVRLNAVLLLPVLAAAHVTCRGWSLASIRRGLTEPRLWAAGGAFVVTMAILQPYLVISPLRVLSVRGPLDFAHVLTVVGGSTPQLYTLQYTGTTPLVYQWTHLLPLAFGWPLTVAAAVALPAAFRGLHWRRAVLLLWVALYLITAAPLFVKPVRYLLPIVPPLLILAADLCRRLWNCGAGRSRWVLWFAVAGVVAHSVFYGLAYMRVWTQEDSRIQAGRWIAAHVPAGSRIAIEHGAFPMGPVIDTERYDVREFWTGLLFYARGQLLGRTTADLIESRLGRAEYVAITDVNRLTHLLAAPEALPVVTSFYRRLTAGTLGYRLVERFKVYPELAGVRFDDDGAEHSFLGFDHPAVLLFRRGPDEQADAAWDRWLNDLGREPFSVDADIEAGVAAMRGGDAETALRLFEGAQQSPSSGTLARFLASLSRSHTGLPWGRGLVLHELIAVSLIDLSLPATALSVLKHQADVRGKDCDYARLNTLIAQHMQRLSYPDQAAETRRLASTMCDQ
ncbi:MAG TPA: glycosyltransferase family 39 protein [Candidatus Latescibacteria bacterium]|nr:hypothetical protein [Gemmatimonadaceae bacterium]MDP6017139.1 glycosyltransferase family 39 protein [Candidatus Latescibacterota bacterium]HJP29813.1 glycosyltransferase family 39 protein [Candidatus Latescibacterota bacterium]